MSRPRNIRRKEQPPDDETNDQTGQTQIWSRQQKTAGRMEERLPMASLNLDEIQERVSEDQPVELLQDEPSLDLFLAERAAEARAQRESARLQNDEYISLEGDGVTGEVGPLEMIAETGVDEEVYDDLRSGNRIPFGMPKEQDTVQSFDQEEEDEEMQQWELAQIKKGMTSAGVRPEKLARVASERLAKEMDPSNRTDFIRFDSISTCQNTLIHQIAELEGMLNDQLIALQSLEADLRVLSLEPSKDHVHGLEADLESFKDLESYLRNVSKFGSEVLEALDDDAEGTDRVNAIVSDTLPEYTDLKLVLDALVKNSIPFESLELIEPYLCINLLGFKDSDKLEELLEHFMCGHAFSDAFKCSLMDRIIMPRLFAKMSASFDPASNEQAIAIKNRLNEFTTIVGHENKNIKMFKLILSDTIDEAKSAQQPGSETLNRILLSQSILQL